MCSHPLPGSLVISGTDRSSPVPPKNKDAQRLDLFGRNVYSTASLQLHISNQQALLGRYNFNIWDSMAKFKDSLPQESRQEFTAVPKEGKTVARASLQAALVAADSATRIMASAISMRRSSWLPSSPLSHEVQQSIREHSTVLRTDGH